MIYQQIVECTAQIDRIIDQMMILLAMEAQKVSKFASDCKKMLLPCATI